MGDLDTWNIFITENSLSSVIFNIILLVTFRDILRRFGLMKIFRRDYYECGFKPQTQKAIRMSIQFLALCIFFLVYDVELVFLFPYVSGISHIGLYENILIIFFFFMFFLSLFVDYERHVFDWKNL